MKILAVALLLTLPLPVQAEDTVPAEKPSSEIAPENAPAEPPGKVEGEAYPGGPGLEAKLHPGDCLEAETMKGRYRAAAKRFLDTYRRGPTEQSLAELEEITRACPAFVEAWVLQSYMHWELGDWLDRDEEEARKAHFDAGVAAGERGLQVDPDSVGALYWKTTNMANQAELKGWFSSLWIFDTLLENMDTVDAKDPHYFHGATDRFWCEILTRIPLWVAGSLGYEVEDVIKDLEAEITLAPNYFANYVYAARIRAKMDEEDRAAEHLRFVIESKPEIVPSRAGDQRNQQRVARKLWKELFDADYPDRD